MGAVFAKIALFDRIVGIAARQRLLPAGKIPLPIAGVSEVGRGESGQLLARIAGDIAKGLIHREEASAVRIGQDIAGAIQFEERPKITFAGAHLALGDFLLRDVAIDLDEGCELAAFLVVGNPGGEEDASPSIAMVVRDLAFPAAFRPSLGFEDFPRFGKLRAQQLHAILAERFRGGPSVELLVGGAPERDVAVEIPRHNVCVGQHRLLLAQFLTEIPRCARDGFIGIHSGRGHACRELGRLWTAIGHVSFRGIKLPRDAAARDRGSP